MQWRHLECGCGFKRYEWLKTWWLNTVVPGERIDKEAYRIGTGERGFVRAIGDLRTCTMELRVSDQIDERSGYLESENRCESWRSNWSGWCSGNTIDVRYTAEESNSSLCRITDCSDEQIFHGLKFPRQSVGRISSVSTATRYVLDGPRIESQWVRDFPHLSRPALGPTQLPETAAAMFKVKRLPSSWRYDTV
jgi:hypothetical protein